MSSAQQRLDFKIHGMDCAEEVAVLKRELGPLVGGEDRLSFDILKGRIRIAPGPSEISPDALLEAVGRTGMRAEVWRNESDELRPRGFWERHQRTVLTAASGLLTLAGFLSHDWLAGGFREALGSEGMSAGLSVPLASRLLYGLAILAGGWHVFPKAWFALKRLRPDMNLLMVVAVLGAVAIGEWLATVTFLFAVSLALGSESFMGTKIYQPLRQALFARADLLGARPVQMSCLWRV